MCTKEDNPILKHIKGDNYLFGAMGFLYDLTHSSSLKLNCLLFRQYEFSKKSHTCHGDSEVLQDSSIQLTALLQVNIRRVLVCSKTSKRYSVGLKCIKTNVAILIS